MKVTIMTFLSLFRLAVPGTHLRGLLLPLLALLFLIPSEAPAQTQPATGGPALFSEAPVPATVPATVPTLAAYNQGGMSKTTKIVIFSTLGLFIVLLHVFLAVFIGMDGKRNKVPGTAGWVVFALLPLLGFVSLIIYLVIVNGVKNQRMVEENERKARVAQQRLEERYKELLEQKDQQISSIKRSQPGIPDIDEADDKTVPLMFKESSSLMLVHLGGERHGHPEILDFRSGRGEKPVIIGKNPTKDSSGFPCIPLPWDNTVSSSHCRVFFETGLKGEKKYYVYDLDSSNHTYVKRGADKYRQVTKEYLQDGDILKLAGSQFRVVVIPAFVSVNDPNISQEQISDLGMSQEFAG